MLSRSIVLIGTLILTLPTSVLAQGIREQVASLRPGDSLQVTRSPMLPSMDLPAVVRGSESGIEGIIATKEAQITSDGSFVETVYTVTVTRALTGTGTVGSLMGPSIDVVVYGGNITVDGHDVHAVDTSLPPLEVGSEVVLFVKRTQSLPQRFVLVAGPYSAFLIERGKISSLLQADEAIRLKYDGMDAGAFRRAAQAAFATGRD